jgi:uncharacterized protein (TIGR03435 family)
MEAKVSDRDAGNLQKLAEDQREHVMALMLRALLADRFKLAIHTDPIPLPIFELVTAKGRPKLKEESPKDPSLPQGMILVEHGRIEAQGVTIGRLAEVLSVQVQRGVVDRTELTGTYTFSLVWEPDEEGASGVPVSSQETGVAREGAIPLSKNFGPSLFSSLKEQLGLTLKAAKGPGEALVIDHVEVPSSN